MRLLSEEPERLVFGGLSGGVIVGVGLVVAGLGFGVAPLYAYLRGGEVSFLIMSGVGVALLFAGLWAAGHKHRIELDGGAGVVRVMRGNRFLSSPDSIPFGQVTEVGITRRLYTSASGGTAWQYYVLELRLADGGSIEIQDQDAERDQQRTLQRGRRVAELVGAPFKSEVSTPS